MTKIHELKSWPHLFSEVVSGTKTHELRVNDRDFEVGDILILKEFNPKLEAFSGRTCKVVVTYITSVKNPCALSNRALHEDYCILSIRKIEE